MTSSGGLFGRDERVLVTGQSPEECLARITLWVPAQPRFHWLFWWRGLALGRGRRVFVETGSGWFRLTQVTVMGTLLTGDVCVEGGVRATDAGTIVEVAATRPLFVPPPGWTAALLAYLLGVLVLGPDAGLWPNPRAVLALFALCHGLVSRLTPRAAASRPLFDLVRAAFGADFVETRTPGAAGTTRRASTAARGRPAPAPGPLHWSD
jgi:hypothetical protein